MAAKSVQEKVDTYITLCVSPFLHRPGRQLTEDEKIEHDTIRELFNLGLPFSAIKSRRASQNALPWPVTPVLYASKNLGTRLDIYVDAHLQGCSQEYESHVEVQEVHSFAKVQVNSITYQTELVGRGSYPCLAVVITKGSSEEKGITMTHASLEKLLKVSVDFHKLSHFQDLPEDACVCRTEGINACKVKEVMKALMIICQTQHQATHELEMMLSVVSYFRVAVHPNRDATPQQQAQFRKCPLNCKKVLLRRFPRPL